MSGPDEGKLFERLIAFARLLRRAGIPIGPGSVIDALQAFRIAGIGTRADFFWTLHSVLIKRHEHFAVFLKQGTLCSHLLRQVQNLRQGTTLWGGS